MLYRDICRILAMYLWGLIGALSIPFCIAAYCEWIAPPFTYPQPPCALAFFSTQLICAMFAFLFYWIGKKGTGQLYRREALLLVLGVYFLTSFLGALPFLFNGTFKNPVDAFFESVSGLTTTGATVVEAKAYDLQSGQEIPHTKVFLTGKEVSYTYYGTIQPVIDPATGKPFLTGIEALSPALVFWRSLLQWLGGGGIVVLFVAILPALGVGGKVLYQTEVTGPTKESLQPRIKETASNLWKIYLGLTLLQTGLLVATNTQMPLFDAIVISMSTVSTGGFAPRNGSIAAYQNPYTDWVIIVFMLLGSINFSLYFFCMHGKLKRLNDPELKVFLLIVFFSCLFAIWQLIGHSVCPLIPTLEEKAFSLADTIRYGTFQIISAQTSTGFAVCNFDLWPFSIQTLILILMFVGGMAGSTAGGLKVIRAQVFFRVMLNKIESIFHPDIIRPFRIGKTTIEPSSAMTVLCFIMVAASLTILGTFLLVLNGMDPEASLTTVSSMMNNVGFAFRIAGPANSFAFLSDFGKLLSCLWMVAGRLELFAVLILFVPSFWRSK